MTRLKPPQSSWLNDSVKRQILSICLFLFTVSAFAGVGDLEKLTHDVETNAGQIDPRLPEELQKFRIKVEATAYQTTLKLCEGYRRALNMGPVTYHKRYMLPSSESLLSWSFILKEGFVQPIDAIFGIKADYLNSLDVKLYDGRSWYLSLYTLYFLNSPGFILGATDCFGVFDSQSINRFAVTIALIDAGGSLPVDYAVGSLLGRILFAAKWFFRPGSVLGNILATRVARTGLIGAKVSGLVLLNDLLLQKSEDASKYGKAIAVFTESHTEHTVIRDKILTLVPGVELLNKFLKDLNNTLLEQKLDYWIANNFSGAKKSEYRKDFEKLREKAERNNDDEVYLKQLDFLFTAFP